MNPILLVGLYPPSNIERTLNDAKQRLFRTFASISAIALGPVVPLRYEPTPMDPPDPRLLPHGIALTTGGWTIVDGTLMLAVEPAQRIEELTEALGGAQGAGGGPARPVPVFPGAYVALPDRARESSRWAGDRPEEPYGIQDMIDYLGSPPRIGWSVSEAVCWSLEISDPRRWWDDVRCRELWRVRLRKGSRGT